VLQKVSLGSALVVMVVMLTPQASSAGAPTPQSMLTAVAPASDPAVERATFYRRDYDNRDYGYRDRRYDDRDYGYRGSYYDRCRWVRHRCASRLGWGGWEFRRCLWWRGCGGERRHY